MSPPKKWLVWESDEPEGGSHLIDAVSEEAAIEQLAQDLNVSADTFEAEEATTEVLAYRAVYAYIDGASTLGELIDEVEEAKRYGAALKAEKTEARNQELVDAVKAR